MVHPKVKQKAADWEWARGGEHVQQQEARCSDGAPPPPSCCCCSPVAMIMNAATAERLRRSGGTL